MKTSLIISLLLLASLSSPAQESISIAEASGYGHKFFDAMLHEDAPTIRSLLTNDFLIVNFDGQLLGGYMLFDGLSKGKLIIESSQVTETDVRVYGRTGIVTGRWKVKGVIDGTPHDTQVIFNLVIVRQTEDWKIASVQFTPIPG